MIWFRSILCATSTVSREGASHHDEDEDQEQQEGDGGGQRQGSPVKCAYKDNINGHWKES